MGIQTSAGSSISIATGTPATYDATGFNALTYTVVGEVTDLGEIGKEFNLVSYTALNTRQTRKFKSSYNNGSLPLQMGRDVSNAGQTALKTALASDASYSFKITLQDGTKLYFTAKVMSFKTNIGGVDQITGASATLEVDSDITEV